MTKSQGFSVAMMVGKTWIILRAVVPRQLEKALVCGCGREIFWRDMVGFGRVTEEIEVKAVGGTFEGGKEGHAYHDVRDLLEVEVFVFRWKDLAYPEYFGKNPGIPFGL